jgi:hypothetical protein
MTILNKINSKFNKKLDESNSKFNGNGEVDINNNQLKFS